MNAGAPSIIRGAHNATGGGGGGGGGGGSSASSRAEKPQAGGGGGRRAGASSGRGQVTPVTRKPLPARPPGGGDALWGPGEGGCGLPLGETLESHSSGPLAQHFFFFLKERNPKAPTLLRRPKPPTIPGRSQGPSPHGRPAARGPGRGTEVGVPAAPPPFRGLHPSRSPAAAPEVSQGRGGCCGGAGGGGAGGSPERPSPGS